MRLRSRHRPPSVRDKLALGETPAGSTGLIRGGVDAPELKGYLVLFLHYACTVYDAHVVTNTQSSLIVRARCII